MKKIQYLIGMVLSMSLAFGVTSCDDVPAPFEINDKDNGSSANAPGKTRENAFSVTEAVTAFTAGKTGNFWVNGYIVGFVPTGAEATTIANTSFSATDAQPSNIVIAASASETTTGNCLVVQLPTGAIRTALNLADHADNLGKAVLLYGSLEKYFGGAGLKSPTYAEFEGVQYGNDPDAGTQTTFEHITIAEFLERKDVNTAYELTGVATSLNETYASFDLTENGATVYVYKTIDASGKTVSLSGLGVEAGDTVTVTGVYLAYTDKSGNVKDEINPATFVRVKKAPKQTTFEHITIAQFLEKKDTEVAYELTGVASALNTTYASFDLTQDDAKVYIYRLNDATGAKADLTALNIEEGDTVTLTGKYLAYTDKNGTVKDEINPATFVSVKKANGTVTPPTPTPDGAIVFDFSANALGIPTDKAAAEATSASTYTSGQYSIVCTPAGSGNACYYSASGKCLILGKQGATLTISGFTTTVAKIEVVGTSGASASVKQNIYCGDDAVSIETVGAKDVTNTYIIADAYRNKSSYTLKITSAHNTQIASIKIYDEAEPLVVETPTYSFTAGFPDGWTLANKTLPSGAENIWLFDSKYSCVKATGYVSGAAAAAEGWLISPAVTLADGKFTYKECGNYFDDAENLLKYTSVKISADGGTTWSDLTCTRNATGKAFSFVESSADVSAYVGQTVKVAFVYTSDTSMAGTWELESIVLK